MCEQVGISLGWNCFSAGMGVQTGIRKRKAQGYNTCPFDECISNYPGVVECVADDFKYFTDVNHLKVIPAEFTCGGIIQGEPLLYNTYYNFIFNHESPGHANLYEKQQWVGGKNHYVANDFLLFRDRYNRRIQNFRSYVNENSVNFIVHRVQDTTPELNNTLASTHYKLDYVVTHLPLCDVDMFRQHLKLMKVEELLMNQELRID